MRKILSVAFALCLVMFAVTPAWAGYSVGLISNVMSCRLAW